MNEYIITFINEEGVYQELTFRGVSQTVAASLAEGLNRSPFQSVTLTKREPTQISLDPAPLVPAPPLPTIPDIPADPPVDQGGDTGPSEPMATGRKKK